VAALFGLLMFLALAALARLVSAPSEINRARWAVKESNLQP
jgi:hypothetical protein